MQRYYLHDGLVIDGYAAHKAHLETCQHPSCVAHREMMNKASADFAARLMQNLKANGAAFLGATKGKT